MCLAVNDAFVLQAWALAKGAGDKVRMLADGSAELTRAMGLELDGSGFGMGIRSQRYAAVIEDRVLTSLQVDKLAKFEVSSAESILAVL